MRYLILLALCACGSADPQKTSTTTSGSGPGNQDSYSDYSSGGSYLPNDCTTGTEQVIKLPDGHIVVVFIPSLCNTGFWIDKGDPAPDNRGDPAPDNKGEPQVSARKFNINSQTPTIVGAQQGANAR